MMPLVSSKSRARALALVATLSGVLVVGCYNPSISEKLQCNKFYMAGMGDCPDGYSCGADGHCHKGANGSGTAGNGSAGHGGSTGAAGAAVGTGGHVDGGAGASAGSTGSGGSPPDSGADVPPVCINTPVMSCTADTAGKTCDPVCQVGCGLQPEVLGEHRRRAPDLQRAARQQLRAEGSR